MTVYEKWLLDQATELAKDDAAANREVSSTLEQRIAIGLCESRAAECRHLAGEIHLKAAAVPQQLQSGIQPMLNFAAYLSRRSDALEKIGLRLVYDWPPDSLTRPLRCPACERDTIRFKHELNGAFWWTCEKCEHSWIAGAPLPMLVTMEGIQ